MEASLYLFESGKITEEDHQMNKQSTGQPEWFTEIDTNQDEFIQLQELDNTYYYTQFSIKEFEFKFFKKF